MKRLTPAATAASMAMFWLPMASVPTTETTASFPSNAALSASNEPKSTLLTSTPSGNLGVEFVDPSRVTPVTEKPAETSSRMMDGPKFPVPWRVGVELAMLVWGADRGCLYPEDGHGLDGHHC